MRYILVALGLLALAIYVLGAMLPPTRQGRAEILITATPARILEVIRDYMAQPQWRKGIASVRAQGDSWVEITARGDEITFTPKTMTEQDIILDFTSQSGFTGTWAAQMRARANQTHIEVIETVNVPSPLGRIISRLLFNPEKFAATYLIDLKSRAESTP